MGIFDFLFSKPPKIEHEFFGTMLFLGDKKQPLKGYFECRRHFAPTKDIIEIGMDGSESGPTQGQIDFFKSIEDNYTTIVNSITPLIEDEFGNWKEGFRIKNFQEEFKAVHLHLPRCETRPIIWEIAFETDYDRNHLFSLSMSDFEATDIHIDG